mmetsp:Transcript_75411/g.245299  ORF Transcript_75411/g.245299 Transcript_75411/m.245299 type:complete len:224 (-) Transcript_75411:85-756(-)
MAVICAQICKVFKSNLEKQFQQFLILGPEKSGKTTLLYRLKFGKNWHDMSKDLELMRNEWKDDDWDAGFHYEEYSMMSNCGVWDIPAHLSQVVNTWYNSLLIHGVFFVVDANDTDPQRILEARNALHRLMNEDALRKAAFAVIINKRYDKAQPTDDPKEKHPLHYRLGLHDVHDSCSWRVQAFVLDVDGLNGERDNAWHPVVVHMKTVLERSSGLHFTDSDYA